MSIDVVGISPVSNFIRQSALTKFVIYRDGAGKGSVPVFENIYGSSNAKLCESFTDWANNLLNSNPANSTVYEILLFNERALIDEDEDPEASSAPAIKRNKQKSNRIRFRFQLVSSQYGMPVINGPNAGHGLTLEDVSKLLDEKIVKVEQEKTQNEILQRLKRLEEGDDDEEMEEGADTGDTLGRIESLFDRVESWGKLGAKKAAEKTVSAPKPEAVSGIEDISKKVGRDVKANINKAVTKLYKFDKDLDLDLLKLAELAEKDNAQFTMFVNALRKM